MNEINDALRDFIREENHHISNLFFQLRDTLDIHALPPDVKLALRDIEAWHLKAKAVVGGMDPRAKYDLSSFSRTFSPQLRVVKPGEDPTAPRVTDMDGMRIVELP